MTAFITRCSPRPPPERPERDWPATGLRICLALALCLYLALARAGSIEPMKAALLPTDEGYALSAEFAIDLGPRIEEALSHGIALYFNLELELNRPRKYWLDEHIGGHSLTYRLSYNPLMRQYRLSTGPLQQTNFPTLEQALRALGRIAALPVLEKGRLKTGETYQASLRLALDRSLLPKPFQLDALASRDWQVDAKVLHWQFQAAEAGK